MTTSTTLPPSIPCGRGFIPTSSATREQVSAFALSLLAMIEELTRDLAAPTDDTDIEGLRSKRRAASEMFDAATAALELWLPDDPPARTFAEVAARHAETPLASGRMT